MASRPTVDMKGTTVVFVCGAPTVGCEETNCRDKATGSCAHELTGRLAGRTCGRKVCARHAMAVDDVLRCGPHARMAMKAKAL